MLNLILNIWFLTFENSISKLLKINKKLVKILYNDRCRSALNVKLSFLNIIYFKKKLRELSNNIRALKLKSTSEGERDANRRKNRYRDILPYDETRVKLDTLRAPSSAEAIAGSDYINATFVQSSIDSYYQYIAAQGPTKETCLDFVRMLVQYRCKLVICACNEFEGQKLKCHRYWPESMDETYCIYKNYYASLVTEPVEFADCIIRHIRVRYIPAAALGKPDTDRSDQPSSAVGQTWVF